MAIFKCKMCGGTIEFNEGDTIGVCDSCGTKQTLPRLDSDRKTNLYDRANHFRRNNEFDKAMSIYENILNEDQSDAEAYWSIVLCRYGIEYVEDPATHRRLPTVNRAQFTSIFDDEDYKSALKNADAQQRSIYEDEARTINEIQKGILEISAKEEPFDVFICYKETDANGRRTPDSVLATDLYHQLTNEGFKVFFSRITLEDKLGQEYEPYIFAALNSAKAMVVMGTRPEHFNAVWVKNEWSRYLALIKAGAKKTLIPAYRDMDPYDLPDEFSHLQAQDMSKLGFMQDLIRGIKKIVRTDEPKQTTIRETVIQQSAQSNTAPLLERAFMFLEDGEWTKADSFCEQVLNIEPKNAEAYLGKLMAGLQVRSRNALKDQPQPFDDRNSYQKAIRFGDDALKKKLTADNAFIRERNETARKEGIYQEASRTMRTSFTDAAKLFARIPDYKDAAAKKEECETKAEEARIAAEKRKKRNKKIALIVLAVIAVAIAAVILFFTVIQPNQRYNKAKALYEAGQYEVAIAAFTALDGYKDSAAQIEKCETAIKDEKYAAAVELYAAGKYEDAYIAFSSLDYKDSLVKADECLFLMQKAGLSNVSVGSTIKFGSYEQDNNTSNGKEEIEWLILAKDGNKVLVISKYALDCQQYNTSYTGVTWETCSLRKWLNDTFYNAAFGSNHQNMVISSIVTADKNPSYSTKPGNNTTDKVFLLSITEVNKYFSSNEARKCAPTDYAIAQGAYTSSSNSTGGKDNCCWWLRSPGYDSRYAADVDIGGSVSNRGGNIDYSNVAVRPALWIDIE